MRRGGGSIGARNLLILTVVKVWEIEMTVGRADFHFVEGIPYVGIAHFVEPHRVGIVGLDRDQGDSPVPVICGQLLDASFVELRSGTVVARKRDHQYLA